MDRNSVAGLEVKTFDSPEVAPGPDAHKYFAEAPGSNHPIYPTQNQSNGPGETKKSRRRAIWLLAAIAIICLAVALGVGLGVGLAAQHKSSSPSGASTVSASNTPVTVTQIGDITTITPTPTTPSPSCPAANGSTYTANNRPLITEGSQSTRTSLAYEILCDTNTAEGGSVLDLQIITNITSFSDCLQACALFNFQTKQVHFPADACTGFSWGHGSNLNPSNTCWLKSGVTLRSPNNTDVFPGYDAAVLLSN